MTGFDIFVQAIGLVGFFLSIGAYQCKGRVGILIWQLIASLCWGTQYLLLGAFSGAVLNLINILRTGVFCFRGKKWADHWVWLPVFLGLCAAATVWTWEGPISLLPMCGMVLTTFAQRAPTARLVRLISLPNDPLWLIYNGLSGSIFGVVTEAFIICSILVGYLRHDRKKAEK